GGATKRFALLHAPPYTFPRRLGFSAHGGQVDAGNDAIAHAHHAVDDDGDDVVADAALHQGFDRIANRPEAEAVPRLEIDHHDVGLGAGSQATEILTPERAGAAERRRLEHLRGRRAQEVLAHDLAEVGRHAHLHDEVARIGVAAEGQIDARGAVFLPGGERERTARAVSRGVRPGTAVAPHQLEVAAARIAHEPVVGAEVLVLDGEIAAAR